MGRPNCAAGFAKYESGNIEGTGDVREIAGPDPGTRRAALAPVGEVLVTEFPWDWA
jgi:hypothetical protein